MTGKSIDRGEAGPGFGELEIVGQVLAEGSTEEIVIDPMTVLLNELIASGLSPSQAAAAIDREYLT